MLSVLINRYFDLKCITDVKKFKQKMSQMPAFDTY